ncbi:MAG: ThuA domain-containing protein [Oscillospiraceae bacterium]|nr:ThuA domain-containing protein [Oscillospiraceae bacterium]
MKCLLICDDHWHPGVVPSDGVKPLEAKGFSFDVVTDAGTFSPECLSNYPVVVLCKGEGWMTEETENAFIRYAENGGGLLAVHNGTVTTDANLALGRLLGCRFSYHPCDCPVMVQPLKPHPVTEGVEAFCEVDEHYRLEILSNDSDILMASYSPPQGEEHLYRENPYHNSPAWICPAGLVRTQGKGRVCVLTPGHHPAVWQNQQVQRLLENALRWCAER